MATGSPQLLLRKFKPEDYEEYNSWWTKSAPPMGSLPNVGLVYGDMKAVGFLALTDCDFSILTWWYANPHNNPKESKEALTGLFTGLCDISHLMGKKNVFCYTDIRSVKNLLKGIGFKEPQNGHMVKDE